MKIANALLKVITILVISVSPLQAEILVGFAGPLTGPRAWSGQQFQRGAEQAVSDINRRGGVLGQRLILVVGDDASDVRQARAVANKLVADGVVLVIGHRSSDMTKAAAEIYAAAGVIQITPSSTNPAITEQGIKTFFRVCGRDDQQSVLTAEYLHQHWSDKSIGIVHDNSSYGMGLAQQTRQRLNALGTREKLFLGFEPGQLDYGELLAEVIDSLAPPDGFVVDVAANMPTLYTDRLYLYQVFSNLIGNGIKHGKGEQGRIGVTVRKLGEYYEFTVSDDGPGIAAEYHDKVFMMFQTLAVHDYGSNTGIGLALVKKLVQEHGGSITLESEEGHGATFRFSWPGHG